MEEYLIQFYLEIYNLVKSEKKYSGLIYLCPEEIAAFRLATREARDGISIVGKKMLLQKIENELNNSEIIFNVGTSDYLQEILFFSGSKCKAKESYTQIEFLSLLTSLKKMNIIDFIDIIHNIWYPRKNNLDLQKIAFGFLAERMIRNMGIEIRK